MSSAPGVTATTAVLAPAAATTAEISSSWSTFSGLAQTPPTVLCGPNSRLACERNRPSRNWALGPYLAGVAEREVHPVGAFGAACRDKDDRVRRLLRERHRCRNVPLLRHVNKVDTNFAVARSVADDAGPRPNRIQR